MIARFQTIIAKQRIKLKRSHVAGMLRGFGVIKGIKARHVGRAADTGLTGCTCSKHNYFNRLSQILGFRLVLKIEMTTIVLFC